MICAEDVGLGNPNSIVIVNKLYQRWWTVIGGKGLSKSHMKVEARRLLVEACLVLCKSMKSRMAGIC